MRKVCQVDLAEVWLPSNDSSVGSKGPHGGDRTQLVDEHRHRDHHEGGRGELADSADASLDDGALKVAAVDAATMPLGSPMVCFNGTPSEQISTVRTRASGWSLQPLAHSLTQMGTNGVRFVPQGSYLANRRRRRPKSQNAATRMRTQSTGCTTRPRMAAMATMMMATMMSNSKG
jgi:hypothetical protein